MFGFFTNAAKEISAFGDKVRKRKARRKRRRFRQRIFFRDRGICQLCEKPVRFDDMTLDHVVPLVHGGSDRHKENFVIAHQRCNQIKGQLMLEDIDDLDPAILWIRFRERIEEIQ